MYYNGNNRYPIKSFLNTVHKDLINKYATANQEEINNAAKLQEFFQTLKRGAKNYNNKDIIESEVIQLILDEINTLGIKKHSNFNIARMFGERGGSRFENEITRVIEAVYNNLTDDDFIFDSTQVNIGGERISTDLTQEILGEKKIQQTMKALGVKTQKNIQDNNTGEISKQYYFQDVDGKIDIKGYEITITAKPNEELLAIYNLLKDATFTAKNYDSKTNYWLGEEFTEDISSNPIGLGETNPIRAIYSVLSDFGYEHRTSLSAICHGYNKIKKENDETVITHMYHLKLAYELMGIGLKYQGKSYGIAKYLIYNDPSGDIYVKSTIDILSNLLKEENIPGNPFGRITLSRNRVK